jgi:hypothetical protein
MRASDDHPAHRVSSGRTSVANDERVAYPQPGRFILPNEKSNGSNGSDFDVTMTSWFDHLNHLSGVRVREPDTVPEFRNRNAPSSLGQ